MTQATRDGAVAQKFFTDAVQAETFNGIGRLE